jgi:hypothetical protein
MPGSQQVSYGVLSVSSADGQALPQRAAPRALQFTFVQVLSRYSMQSRSSAHQAATSHQRTICSRHQASWKLVIRLVACDGFMVSSKLLSRMHCQSSCAWLLHARTHRWGPRSSSSMTSQSAIQVPNVYRAVVLEVPGCWICTQLLRCSSMQRPARRTKAQEVHYALRPQQQACWLCPRTKVHDASTCRWCGSACNVAVAVSSILPLPVGAEQPLHTDTS